jgi:hypothetical protein
MRSIVDANVTHILIGAVLFIFGSGPHQGNQRYLTVPHFIFSKNDHYVSAIAVIVVLFHFQQNGLDQGVDFVEVEHFKFVLRSQLKQNWLKSSCQKFLTEVLK